MKITHRAYEMTLVRSQVGAENCACVWVIVHENHEGIHISARRFTTTLRGAT